MSALRTADGINKSSINIIQILGVFLCLSRSLCYFSGLFFSLWAMKKKSASCMVAVRLFSNLDG